MNATGIYPRLVTGVEFDGVQVNSPVSALNLAPDGKPVMLIGARLPSASVAL